MITSTISAREEKPSRKTDIATYWVASGHPTFALTSSNSHNFAEILRPWFWGQVHLFHPQLPSWCSQGTSAAWLPQPCSVHLNKRSLAQSRLGFQLSGYPAGQTKVNNSSRNRRVCWLCFMIHDSWFIAFLSSRKIHFAQKTDFILSYQRERFSSPETLTKIQRDFCKNRELNGVLTRKSDTVRFEFSPSSSTEDVCLLTCRVRAEV